MTNEKSLFLVNFDNVIVNVWTKYEQKPIVYRIGFALSFGGLGF